MRSVWDYHHHVPQFIDWLAKIERAKIPLINSSEVVRWNIFKSYLKDLEKFGIPIVPSIFLSQSLAESEAIRQIRQTGWGGVVLKPTVSATAYLTFRSSVTDVNLAELVRRVQTQSDVIVQPFIESVPSQGEVSLIFFFNRGARFSHAVLKSPKRGDFRVQSNFGGDVVAIQPSAELIGFAERCVQAIPGQWVYARVDVIDWDTNPLLGELELIEPDLFLSYDHGAAQRFVEAISQAALNGTAGVL